MATQIPEHNKIKKLLTKEGELCVYNPYDYVRFLWWVLIEPKYLKIYIEIWGTKNLRNMQCWLVSSLVWSPPFVASLALWAKLIPQVSTAWLNAWPIEIYLVIAGIILICWLGNAILGRANNKKISNIWLWMIFALIGLPTGFITFAIVDGIGLIADKVNFFYSLLGVLIVSVSFGLIAGFSANVVDKAVAGIVASVVSIGAATGMAFGIAGLMTGILTFITTLIVGNYIAGKVEQSIYNNNPSFVTNVIFYSLITLYFSLIPILIVIAVSVLLQVENYL